MLFLLNKGKAPLPHVRGLVSVNGVGGYSATIDRARVQFVEKTSHSECILYFFGGTAVTVPMPVREVLTAFGYTSP